jgi:short subunit dehydrogenase-like uncharacterized protein
LAARVVHSVAYCRSFGVRILPVKQCCRLWGEVRNAAGERRTAQLETANGYRLTADGTIMAVQSLLTNVPPGGYYTPSMLLGARCVELLPGSTSIRVE